MATKTVKKKVTKKAPVTGVSFTSVEQVPVGDLKGHAKNPRQGNVDIVAESLSTFGQFRPIIVNSRNNTIIAGHHTWLAARKLGWPTISVAWMDVDDDTHTRIMLMDNRSSDLGTYDDTILAELFASLPDFSGTGYTPAEVQDLIDNVKVDVQESVRNLGDFLSQMPEAEPGTIDSRTNVQKILDAKTEEERAASAKRGAPIPAGEDTEIEDVEDVQAELQAVLESKETMTFPITNYWGIPVLREDMILESFPEPLMTWGGKDATPDDGKTTYVWTDGLASMSGLPNDRSILSFFTYDEKFEKWWNLPGYYTAKVLNYGIRTAFMPDYSTWVDDPRVMHLYNTYRGFWLGRFFQEAGMKVIPVAFHCDLESLKYTIKGIPKGSPTLCIQAQAITRAEMKEQKVPEGVQAIINEIGPKELVIYSGNPGHDMVRELDLESQGVKVIYLMNYSGVRRGTVFDKKDGLAAVSKKKRKSLKEKVTTTDDAVDRPDED